jgi:hypothetical protein
MKVRLDLFPLLFLQQKYRQNIKVLSFVSARSED